MHKKWMILSILVVLSLVLFPNGAVMAQEPIPPDEPPLAAPGGSLGTYQQRIQAALDGEKAELEGFAPVPQGDEGGMDDGPAAGGEDEGQVEAAASDGYNYTRRNLRVEWMDVAGAPGSTLLDFSATEKILITLPFAFPFYEDSLTAVNVVKYGYLTFSRYSSSLSQGTLKHPSQPNSMIAPFWGPLYLDEADEGDVYMLSGGDEPNRWVAFEWNKVSDAWTQGLNSFTFEVILYENGNILFQYGDMIYTRAGRSYTTAGIEDDTGATALVSLAYKSKQPSNRAVLLTRPMPAASVKLYPNLYGAFGRPGIPAEFRLNVENTGQLDVDTFDIRFSSGWPSVAYEADGTTPLVDTDGDRKIDTGPVAPGANVTVVIKVTPPLTAKVGQTRNGIVSFTSSLKSSRKKSATLTTTIPAIFAQTYMKDTLRTLADVNALNVTPQGVVGYPVAPASNGYNPMVVEQPNGNFFYAWSEYPCANNRCERVMYAITDRAGGMVAGPVALRTPPDGTWEYNVAARTAPNGVTGIVFMQEVEVGPGSSLYNVFFTAVNASGSVVVSPVNLTNNSIPEDQAGGLFFYEPQINVTEGSRFFVSINQRGEGLDGLDAADILYTVLESNGATVMGMTNLTNDPGRGMGYYCTSLAPLTGDRMLLAYDGWQTRGNNWSEYAFYTILNNDGTMYRPPVGIGVGKLDSERMDAVQLSNGQVLMAWTVMRSGKQWLQYAVLKENTYTRARGPVALKINAAITGIDRVSVTSDADGHGVLTWMDSQHSFGRNLYYAMVGKNGALMTKPVIFMTAEEGEFVYLTGLGNGNTSYTVNE